MWIDTGGTFTDCLASDPHGELHRAKVLSSSSLRGRIIERLDDTHCRVELGFEATRDLLRGLMFRMLDAAHGSVRIVQFDPSRGVITLAEPADLARGDFTIASPEEAPLLAARLITQRALDEPFPPMRMRLATTRGTNALLERQGARCALFITEGFGDLLSIGTQARPDLFATRIDKPAPLHEHVIEVPERLACDGSILRSIDLNDVQVRAAESLERGVTSAAIALAHSFRNPIHERALADMLTSLGFAHVSVSSDLAPRIKLLDRAETAVVDVYIGPVIGGYVGRVAESVRGGDGGDGGSLHMMTSAGGLVGAASYRAKDSLLSGPAGGVAGAAQAGCRSGCDRLIAFDMGGTSTDVARYDGEFGYVYEHVVGGAHLFAPALAIESVAAGGGSICTFDGDSLKVGPRSAGADPGPACYGLGGPLTLTDVNLLLGRLDIARFGIPIDVARSRQAFNDVRRAVDAPDEEVLSGFLDIANQRMAEAIRRISVREGYDPADYALVAFGGAGAQHACAMAEQLGMATVIVPADAGLLSALGLRHAVIERFAERQVLEPIDDVRPSLDALFEALASQARAEVAAEGIDPADIKIRRRTLHLRFAGQDATVELSYEHGLDIGQAFRERYSTMFGHLPADRAIEVESMRVAASSVSEPTHRESARLQRYEPKRAVTRRAWFGGEWRETPVFDRETLEPGTVVCGPAVVREAHCTTVVEAGWTLQVDEAAALVMEPVERAASVGARSEQGRPEQVQLELFTSRFEAIAREMGEMLRRTALSTNIKERLDFSCAVLDADGELVVNAPHIPVHLGAIGRCVREVAKHVEMHAGDVVVTNHPSYGGSHLPDVTLITPVFCDDDVLIGYVANRAHHAEIGGARPGSMPPDAVCLEEEGVVIAPVHLVRDGTAQWDRIEELLRGGRFPSRAVEDNLADLRAALAANARGRAALVALATQHGTERVAHYMEALQHKAERAMRRALSSLPDGAREATERLDDGSRLCVRITINGSEAAIDFGGSADVHPGNLNATPAVVSSAVLYVLRLLIDEDLPLNEGLMRPVELAIPEGMLNPPFGSDPSACPAVVGGNVETSQRIVDVLLKAFTLQACSQGTMNNVLFGNDRFGYYETICGGSGAGPDYDGADAVHTHMTNTRITDVEVIEHRYPVRVERFEIRTGSGGAGKHRGGDGVVREMTFLAPMSLSVVTQHRTEGPYALAGGEAGQPGLQRIIRASGEVIELAPIDGCDVTAGDRFIIETPGAGAWGEA